MASTSQSKLLKKASFFSSESPSIVAPPRPCFNQLMKFKSSELNIKGFEEMGLSSELLSALNSMKLSQPTPIQCQATPVALQGQDLIGVAETGSGKTLAYCLAVISHLQNHPESRALILTPNRENADQVFRVLSELTKGLKISMSLVTTGIPNATQVSQLKKNPSLIVASPGRLVEHLQGNKLLLKGLSLMVLDEGDRMLDEGFGEQLKFIHSTLRGSRQTLLFAASFGNWAEPLAQLLMRPEAVLIRTAGSERAVPSLKQKIYYVTQAQKNNLLLDELKKIKGGVIIFADRKEHCVSIGRLLEHHSFPSEFVHGDMNPGHRNRVLREFRQGQISILVTTDLLARGLDIEHVDYVISYDLPYKGEEFLHRIGRTARAGRQGQAITFVTPQDGRTFRKMRPYLEGAEEKTLAREFQFKES